MAQPGMETWVRSWVPCGETAGMVIRHGEAFTMSDHLTVWGADGPAGDPVYRPTVHYAYCPADVAIASVHELRMRSWEIQPRHRILNDEIVDGEDQLGVLLLGHDYTGWWTGSLLSIHEARALVPGQNATTLQVAASIVAAITWMIDHPDAGLRVPDELPWDSVLAVARKYLGTCHSDAVDWTPLRTRRALDLFPGLGDASDGLDLDDPWQFGNFLVR
jgi:homospermidine synthase